MNKPLRLSRQEWAHILAALQYCRGFIPDEDLVIEDGNGLAAFQSSKTEPLTDKEVDELCTRLHREEGIEFTDRLPWHAVELFDSSGRPPENLREKMLEYRRTGKIDGYWFINVDDDPDAYGTQTADGQIVFHGDWEKGEPFYKDPYHNNELRLAKDCGPDIDELDWRGLY